MKRLLELVQVINKNKVKVVEVIGSLPPRQTMVQEFYNKLSDGSITDDFSAAQYFYGTSPEDRNYKELKKRLTQRLQNTALFIDLQQATYDEAGKAFYTCWKEFAIAQTLNAKGATLNANALLEKILKQGIRYEFVELILNTCRSLRINYGTGRFDKKKYYHYNELFNKYLKIYQADTLAEEYYATMLVEFYWAKKRDIADLRLKAQPYLDELSCLVEQYSSYRLNLCYRLIKLMVAESRDDLDLSAEICREAMDFFQSEVKYPATAQGVFMRYLSLIYWQQRKYEAVEELLERALEVTSEGNAGWFSNYALLMLLCLHSKKYGRAWEVLNFVMEHPQFKGLSEPLKERWRIFQAYLFYLVGIGKIEGVEMKKFKLNKFLNEVPTFSLDKKSRNIPILIIQILFLILYKKYNDAIDRLEAINQYCNRHLKNDDAFRSNCFIKMLLKIIEADFHRAGAERKASRLRAKLENKPLEVATQVYDTEIIPYEDLWDMALLSLENKFWRPAK